MRYALSNVAGDAETDWIGDAIRTTDEQTTEDTADLAEDRAMTEEALRILASPSPSAYSRALTALREDTQGGGKISLKTMTRNRNRTARTPRA